MLEGEKKKKKKTWSSRDGSNSASMRKWVMKPDVEQDRKEVSRSGPLTATAGERSVRGCDEWTTDNVLEKAGWWWRHGAEWWGWCSGAVQTSARFLFDRVNSATWFAQKHVRFETQSFRLFHSVVVLDHCDVQQSDNLFLQLGLLSLFLWCSL